jgi:hypothetical protein
MTKLTAFLSAFFGLLGGVMIFGSLYFMHDGNFLTWTSLGPTVLIPLVPSFMFIRSPEKFMPEGMVFVGAMLTIEIILLSDTYPPTIAIALVGLLVAIGILAGALSKVFTIELPGLRAPKP